MLFEQNNLIILFLKQFWIFWLFLLLFIFNYINLKGIIILYLLFCLYHKIFCKTHLFYNKNNNKMISILNKCPTITSCNYKPPFFFPINPLQLLNYSRSKVTPKVKVTVNREYVGENGVVLDWVNYEGIDTKNKPVFVILPGLTGSVKDPYVINVADKVINELGFNVAIYQMRLLNENVKIPEKRHLFLIEDVDEAFSYIKKKFGEDIKIYACGFSYGANQIVRYLGEYNYINKKIEAAVSISNPFEFIISARLGLNKLYDRMLLKFLQDVFIKTRSTLEKQKHLKMNFDLIQNTINLNEFDRYYTAYIFNFNSPDEYYRNVSCVKFIKNINVPLLCINALDDQITNKLAIPYNDIEMNENICLLTPDYGTHSCFLEDDNFFGVKQWSVKPIVEFINSVNFLNEIKNKVY